MMNGWKPGVTAAVFVVVLVAQPVVVRGEECPAMPEIVDSTKWDRGRAWIHEAGWFKPLDRPDVVPAKDEEYPANAPMLVVQVGKEARAYPVEAMAYHHVANDIIGGQPVVTTY